MYSRICRSNSLYNFKIQSRCTIVKFEWINSIFKMEIGIVLTKNLITSLSYWSFKFLTISISAWLFTIQAEKHGISKDLVSYISNILTPDENGLPDSASDELKVNYPIQSLHWTKINKDKLFISGTYVQKYRTHTNKRQKA